MVISNRTSAVSHWQEGRGFSLSLKRLQDLTGLTYGSAVRLLMDCPPDGVSPLVSARQPAQRWMTTPVLLAISVQQLARELVEGIGTLLVYSDQQNAVGRTPSVLPHHGVLLPANRRLQPRSFINRQSRRSMPA